MPKASKSSASSGTRKKHARKAGEPPPEASSSSMKSKPSKKEIKKGLVPPPKKSYIAPSKLKPTPVQADPLDSLGLAAVLPADLVVVLRRLAKKDSVTKTRALEELGIKVSNAREENGQFGNGPEHVGASIDVLVTVLPVWLHRYSALSVHSSRRVRHLSASLHASLLEISTLRNAIVTFLLETGSETEVSQVLGAWCLSAWDVDSAVAAVGSKSWKEVIAVRPGQSRPVDEPSEATYFVLDDITLAKSLFPFIQTAVCDPDSTYATLNLSHSIARGDFPSPSQFHVIRQQSPRRALAPPASAGPSATVADSSATPSREDDIESAEDRNARLRVAAMGALKWIFETYAPSKILVDVSRSLLMSPYFWSSLNHAAQPPFLQAHNESDVGGSVGHPLAASGPTKGFGSGQTIVRRAGWGIVQAIMGDSRAGDSTTQWKDNLPLPRLLASAILRSAFVEPDPVVRSSMWGPLLVSLTRLNNAWILDLEFNGNVGDADVSSSDEDDSDKKHDSTADIVSSDSSSFAYAEFLSFLTLGCNGSPIHGYPTILVILSTIPKQLMSPTLPAISEFFNALWAAIDGQAFSTLASERVKGTDAFLRAWGECLIWISGKLVKEVHTPTFVDAASNVHDPEIRTGQGTRFSIACALVEAQMKTLVAHLGTDLRVDASVICDKIVTVLRKLELIASDLYNQAWTQISRFATSTIPSPIDCARGEYALALLANLYQKLPTEGSSRPDVQRVVIAIVKEIVEKCLRQLHAKPAGRDLTEDFKTLENILDRFGPMLEEDEQCIKCIDELFTLNVTRLISRPSLILSYLTHRSDVVQTVAVWRRLLTTLGSSIDVDLEMRMHVLNVLLDSHELDGLVNFVKPAGGELDTLAEHALSMSLDGNSSMSNLVEKLLRKSDAFLDLVVTKNLISEIIQTIATHAELLIQDPSAPLKRLHSSLNLVFALGRHSARTLSTLKELQDVMPKIFLLSFVLPQCAPAEEESRILELSKQVWKTWHESADTKTLDFVSDMIGSVLKELILDTNTRPRPANLLDVSPHAGRHATRLITQILPTQLELDTLLSSTSVNPIDNTLAIIEPLALPSSNTGASNKSSWNNRFDSSGFSPYARGVSSLLHVMTTNRQYARENMWALHHALVLALFASEVLQIPGAPSPVFQLAAEAELRYISRQTQQTAAFLLAFPEEEAWHKEIVNVLAGDSSHSDTLDPMGAFLRLVFNASRIRGTIRDSLVLHTVLQYVLRSATKDDADQWIELARNLDDKVLQTSLAISLAVTEYAPEPPKLIRYRNELASKLAEIPPAKANTSGLRLLRRLCAVAPDPESEVIFLPQQRAVFLVQALQTWMVSDEDLSESVESEVALVLFHLSPILQNVQGSHWHFVMDLIESNVENSSFKDAETLVLLSRSLRLLTSIQDLSTSNKHLRELWSERSKIVLIMVRNLLTVKVDRRSPSVPHAVVREQALSIVQNLPASLMDETTFSAMCHLLTDSSVDVQKMAYHLLQRAATKWTEYIVVEAGVNSDTAVIQLPPELISLVQGSMNLESIGSIQKNQDFLSYLFGWMILFDLFTDASLKVKTGYVDQMRNLNLIGDHFLPNIFEILGIGGAGQKPFKLDVWAIDEYWPTLYDSDAPQSLSLLAAHLYYRALLIVPSLIRTWFDELKDRQLLTAVTSITSSHFSPVLITSELSHIKPSSNSPAAGEESLTDESFNVKLALAIHEVTATFNVDDQQMEIGVRLPADYPLRAVEVRGVRRVGVPEKLWRKWLFAVQQVVTSQNGRIVDALSLFKKNVSLHFEGQVECAICYSIISVVDRSLPSKPCRTCKNRFHSSCLYKWFNTSHSSSCPLCRSDIM